MGDNIVKRILIVIASIFGILFGNDPAILKFVYALIILQCFDIVTGLSVMIHSKEKFDYRIFFEGIMKKVMMLVAVSFGHFVDKFEILGSGIDVKLQMAIVSAWLMVELLSNLSNFKKFGLTIPIVEKYIKLD